MDDDRMRRKFRPILSALLTIAMLMSLLPAAAFAAGETGTFTKITTQEELTDGSYILVANTTAGLKALGTNIGNKIGGTDITIDGTTISSESSIPLWTVSVLENGLTFSNGSNYLGYGSSTSFTKPDEPYTWNISDSGNETFRFTASTASSRAIAWQDEGGRFGAYATSNTQGYVFDLMVYKSDSAPVPDPGGEDPDPQPGESPIKDEDSVVFYLPAQGQVMTTTASGSKLAGQEGTLEGNTLTTDKTAAVFTVGTNEEGQFTFSADGMYLTSGETGNSLTMTETASAYSYWILEKQGEGWLVKNVSAQHNGGAQYIEYFDGFTTYGYKASTPDIYTFQFFQAEKVQEPGSTPEPEHGDSPIYDEEQVVIYNPAYGKALSGTYDGFYNNGTAVTVGTDGTVSGFTASDVWTVIDNGDGTWSFSYGDQKIGMDAEFTSMPLGGVNDKWELSEADNGLYYIKNTGRDAYMEWYDSKDYWSAYYNINAGSEGMFALAFYEVTYIPEPPSGEVEFPEGSFVIYNDGAQGVLAGQDDNPTSPSVNSVAATVSEDGMATPTNGARVFEVEPTTDGYYRFKTNDGYLASNGTGSNAFYQSENEVDQNADWKVTAYNGGYTLMSRIAKYKGNDQYLEYYSGSYKTYSLYDSKPEDDKNIYTFHFYPVVKDVAVTKGVVNIPTVTFGTLPVAYVGQDYTVTFTVDAVFGVNAVSAKYGDIDVVPTNDDGTCSFTIPGNALAGGTLTVTVSGTDTEGVTFEDSAEITVKDEPVITGIFPAANTQTGDNKTPKIGFTFGNAGENPTVTLTVNDTPVELTVSDGKASYTPAADMADGKVTVTATVTRAADGKSATKTWNFTIGTAQYQLYFGQLHSHTKEYSDGAGTLEDGLNYVASLSEEDNVDFVAFTDHSNYFDDKNAANPEAALYDVSQMTEGSAQKWNKYTGDIRDFNERQSDVIALAGFEMTWSGGPGHINTFNTPGIVSRNNTALNNKTADAGMKAYYALLSNEKLVNSISQFNHPGTTFGNFSDFGYYDPIIDTRIQLVEVGNGEGAIGAGGYYPSYEQYIMALDKGWHVAPTNNQDNHKGKWGNANDARDVILTDDFSQEGIYQAIRDRRVYATEDKNLEINYTLNGEMLGSTIADAESANIKVSVYDPDASDSISKVEVVVNSGKVAYTWDDPTELATGELECTIPANYNYYFIRVTQGDGDLAVTAPVWIGEVVKLGISAVECGTSSPVTGEELTLTTTLFNSEVGDATVKSITYSSDDKTLGTDNTGYTIPASGTLDVNWKYTPEVARVMTVTVTAVIERDGLEYSYVKNVTLDVGDASKLVYIGIDASHYNEYVAGNYNDSMGNFSNLAAGYSVRTVQLNTSEELIDACRNAKYKAIILTAPSRRNGDDLRKPYATYSEEEIQAIADFNAAGGAVVVAGWSDYYEKYDTFPAEDHMAAQQNKLLAALGSSLRIGDDATNDNELNGGQTQRLYFSTYNWDNFLMEGVEFDPENPNNNLYTELFSQYGGASIYVVDGEGDATTTVPATVSPVVYGHATTYSKDSDNDSLGGDAMPKYAVAEGDERLMVLATEQLEGKGLIVVSGAAFMSNFEVQAQIGDSGSEKNYSNYKICENLVNYLNPVTITPIKDVQAQKDEGIKYTIEGVVTSNASGYDKDTAFFDCIYVQDGTAGINAFPVAGSFKVGDKVRITGTTSSYQGERQIAVTFIEKIGEESPLEPKLITTKEASQNAYLGSLVKIQGVVVSFAEAEGSIQTIMVRNKSGYDARVFIDGYITQNKTIENLAVGHEITVVGLSSYDNSFDGPAPRIRVRDRAEIVCVTEVMDIPPAYTPPSGGGGSKDPATPDPSKFTDLDENAWYYDDVVDVIKDGLMEGVSSTKFGPELVVNRAMVATILYRLSGEKFDGSAAFPDVTVDSWYDEAVAWAADRGVVTGYDNGNFGPEDAVTREQMVTMFRRFWAYQENSGGQTDGLSAYVDADQISQYAVDAMQWAVGMGLINGRSSQLLTPAAQACRAELCALLNRYQDLK